MYKVYGAVKSRAFRVLWMLEEMGLPYEWVDCGPRSEEARSVHPAGKIPVLLDGDDALFDSVAIMTYLGDKHGALTFPAGTVDRARQDALTHMVNDELDAVLWTAARHSFVLPEDKRVPQITDSLKWELERNLGHLSDRLEGPFLQGETMTHADILAVHCLNWARGFGFPTGDEKLLDYGKRLRSREAFKKVVALAG